MKTPISTIFKNAWYTAETWVNPRGISYLCITYNRKQGGKYVTGEQAEEWIAAIKTAIDPHEAHNLCKAIAP